MGYGETVNRRNGESPVHRLSDSPILEEFIEIKL
jgi:hypothetical protein